MRKKLKVSNLIILIIVIISVSGCVTIYNPATERREMLLIGTEDEIALGQDIDQEIQKRLKILEDPRRQTRLDEIGIRIANASDRQDVEYLFRIVKDNEFNAFAIPGGFVYVNNGLMDVASDDELACVLGHEIGHIAARHSVKRLQAGLGYQLILGIALGASGKQSVLRAVDLTFTLINLGYSRKDESLADRLSVKYARRAGFDPYGAITFLEKLKKEAEKEGPRLDLVFFSSHPPFAERVKNIENEIAKID